LLEQIAATLPTTADLTFELITHRFTEKSKGVLESWYPNSSLDLSQNQRRPKRNAFGGLKFVYNQETMLELKTFFHAEIAARFPNAKILYWT
jgi:spore photoproduct lyase